MAGVSQFGPEGTYFRRICSTVSPIRSAQPLAGRTGQGILLQQQNELGAPFFPLHIASIDIHKRRFLTNQKN